MRRPRLSLLVGLALIAALSAATMPEAARPRNVAEATPRLAPCATALCRPDGSRFEWRGVTAFALAAQIADGREADARRFVGWASSRGFTVLRVLAMNHGWLELPPEHGRRALPRLFALAAESGMYVQVVALAGTALPPFRSDDFQRSQVRAIGALCADAANCVLEIANEPYHPSQARLDDPSRMQAFSALVPPGVPLAWGAAADHTSDRLAGGTFVVGHLPRSGERWDRVGQRVDLAGLSRRVGKFVVDNEPIGAAERAEPSRREDEPAAFFAHAAVDGVLGLGATFHCDDCLRAAVPGETQQLCAEAFARGARFVASAGATRWLEPGGEGAPIEPVASDVRGRVFMARSEDTAVVVAIGPGTAGSVRWRPGWRVRAHQSEGPAVDAWIADLRP